MGLRLAAVPLLASVPLFALPVGDDRSGAPTPVASAAEEPELSHAEAEVHRILRRARDPEGPPAAEAAVELAPVASEALPLLVEILRARQVPATGELRAQTLSEPQQEILLGALSGLERPRVLEEMQRMLARGRTSASRAAALRLIGAVGRAADTPLLLGLPLERGEQELDPALAEAFQVALAEVVRRDPGALVEISRLWSYRPAALALPLVEGLSDAADPRALVLLDDIFLRHEDMLLPVLAGIRRVGASPSAAVNDQLSQRLRRYLDPSSPACRQAVFALATLRDHDSIPALIEMLGHESRGLRSDAHYALRELTGLEFNLDAALWREWHATEVAWVREHSHAVLERLSSSNDAELAGAIGELARRRLYNDTWAFELVPLLRHPTASVRMLAARALGTLRSPYVVMRLIETLDDAQEPVRDAAHRALRSTTGRSLPADPSAWRALLGDMQV